MGQAERFSFESGLLMTPDDTILCENGSTGKVHPDNIDFKIHEINLFDGQKAEASFSNVENLNDSQMSSSL